MGEDDLAYELFRKAATIDLGPYMGTSDEGIHAASFGGVWQCVVYGFGGVRMLNGKLRVNPRLPKNWEELTFTLCWKGEKLGVTVTKDDVMVRNLTGTKKVAVTVNGREISV